MKRLLGVTLVCLAVVGCKNNEEEKKPVVAVTTQKAVLSSTPLLVSAPATVYGREEAHLSSRITASVQRLLVYKGENVRKGQLLAMLDQRDLAAQRADAAAAVTSAQSQLQKTQNATIPAALTQARGEARARAASLTLAQKVYDHRKDLFQQGAISGRELQTSEAELAQAKANADAAQKNLDVLEHRTSLEDVRVAQSALAQSRAREALASANLSFSEIRSPFNGTVTDQLVFPGDLANLGTPLFTVMDVSSVVARAQVDANKSMHIKIGQACTFQLGKDQETSRIGKISVVNQAVDPARRTVEVWCEIPNKDGVLKAGLFGQVQIATGTAENTIVLPASAVEMVEGTSKGKAYVVDAEHVAHVRDVKAQTLDNGRVRILSGISPGEIVITDGEYGLPDGTSVNPAGVAR